MLASCNLMSIIPSYCAVPYGACSASESYCFGRLPGALEEGDSELLAIDSAGTVYRFVLCMVCTMHTEYPMIHGRNILQSIRLLYKGI